MPFLMPFIPYADLHFQSLSANLEHENGGFFMGFNYSQEKKKFDVEWKKLRQDYEQAGMSEEAIRLLYEYDLE